VTRFTAILSPFHVWSAAAKAPITIQKKRRQDSGDNGPSFNGGEPSARKSRDAGAGHAFVPAPVMPGTPFGAMDPFALMMAMAASQMSGQSGPFGGPVATHEAQDPSRTRCRFFPRCTKPGCPFVHPSVPCRYRQACSFGKQCLYLHPSDVAVRWFCASC
jgi:hypothetical protein